MLAKLPGSVCVSACEVYGHRPTTGAKNCEDTELVAPFGGVTLVRAQMLARLGKLRLHADHALAAACGRRQRQGAHRGASAGARQRWSRDLHCRPCAAAKALAAENAKLVVHAVGLGVDAADATAVHRQHRPAPIKGFWGIQRPMAMVANTGRGGVAERGGFEPPIPLRVCRISSAVQSTGLCHLSRGCLT